MTLRARSTSRIRVIACIALPGAVVVAPSATAATSTSPGATIRFEQGSVTIEPFELPAKGKCVDVPTHWTFTGSDRLILDLSIKVPGTGKRAGMLTFGRSPKKAAIDAFAVEVCRKPSPSMGRIAIRPGADYDATVTVYVRTMRSEGSEYSAPLTTS